MEQINKRLLSWASILDPGTLEQAIRTSSMPFIHPHMALMPDAHLGMGATVGSVIPTERAIIPAAVGVDIGCGMIAVRTQFDAGSFGRQDRQQLRNRIERAVPLSAGHYNSTLTETAKVRCEALDDMAERAGFEPDQYAGNWRQQLGSLGSGNHFIEVSLDEHDRVWLFLHSGSRGIGNRIAKRHIELARRRCEQWWIQLPDRDLAYLVEDTDEFWRYIRELRWAQHFALLNREEMMDRVIACTAEVAGEPVEEQQRINCHHNYTEQERHGGRDVWLTRKGAINAAEGTWGLIPGSMGSASYVVVGKGNAGALQSAPHGAGRSHSRTAARKRFDLDDLTERMRGIEWRRTSAFLDEHPLAYKPIDTVMSDAADLVRIEHTLRQIVNVKGD